MTLSTFKKMWLFYTQFGYPDNYTRNMFPRMTIKEYKQIKKELEKK